MSNFPVVQASSSQQTGPITGLNARLQRSRISEGSVLAATQWVSHPKGRFAHLTVMDK